MKLSSIAVTLLVFLQSFSANAQAPANEVQQDLILSTVYDWAETLSTGDLERRKQVTIDGSMIQRLRQQSDGSFQLSSSTVNFAEMKPSNSIQVERFWSEEVVVRGDFASFIAEYDFWIDGEFSHCGTDVFDLIRLDGQWKIGNMKFTIITEGCPDSPLGELKPN